ncbi:MAG: diversity-generating retroelement protein Avd [Candidatus Sericytochromatia bacterium]|nr:diversity-generating retroelement protein Avd [Candidatus Tanganyikabacteria bacterium]
MSPEPVLVGQWQRLLGDLLDRTARFPKVVRFTFAQRIETLALDVLEDLVEARYGTGHERQKALRRADMRLARMRVLIRLAHDRRYLDHRGYEHVARAMDESGRMLGGWRKGQSGGEGDASEGRDAAAGT